MSKSAHLHLATTPPPPRLVRHHRPQRLLQKRQRTLNLVALLPPVALVIQHHNKRLLQPSQLALVRRPPLLLVLVRHNQPPRLLTSVLACRPVPLPRPKRVIQQALWLCRFRFRSLLPPRHHLRRARLQKGHTMRSIRLLMRTRKDNLLRGRMSAQRCGDETDGDSTLVGESRSEVYCSE